MRAVVTGAAGFIGSRIANRLLNEGWEVTGIDCFTDYYDADIKRSNVDRIDSRRFRLLEVDLAEAHLSDILDGADAVVHQAGQPGVRKSWGTDFSTYLRNNVEVTQRLLEAAREVDTLRRFVYASSSSVYGEAERYPTLETDRPAPRSPYGVTKLAAEHLCSLYAANFGVPTVSLRYFTVYGPGQRPDMAFTRFTRAAATNTPITLYGSGEQIRDFTFVDDVVDANVRAVQADPEPGAVLNISGGSHISVNDALRIIEDVSGKSLTINHEGAVAGDVTRTGGDNARARDVLGWAPRTSIADGLAQHFEWALAAFG